ncbi:MAG: heparinase II/III family protein [Candidatus Hydrogenedentes bacterium]|nr:heparinase II/III family protein [Candidatus Hydrogenedentota bacterium]
MLSASILLVCAASMGAGEDAGGPDGLRTPQFPLKTDRTIYSDADIQRARENIAAYPKAKAIADGIIEAADKWLAWPDAELRELVATADVPRAFNVGTAGCPVCGKKIYEARGTYPWLLDLENPFKVKCPVCGGVFPDNDFRAYYRSGFQDKQYLEGQYVDDGWGWVGPDGQRYWFVAYANHWNMHSHVIRALRQLGFAYLYTGDTRYAHKAAVLLDRIAEVYPAMDYHAQSRYGQLTAKAGGRYEGKIVNHIWATGNLTEMALCYDAIWETIDGDTELQALTGKSGEEIRAGIEANILEEGIDAVFAGVISGNFGMHQRALVYATLARQHGDTAAWLDSIFKRTGCSPLYTGLNYALYNLVYRDGVPYETSPGYNSIWFKTLTMLADTLRGSERDIYAIPKTKRLFDGVLDVINAGQFTPALGDSGSVYGGMVTNAGKFQSGYRVYGDARYLEHLVGLDATGEKSFCSDDTLFRPPIEATSAGPAPARPRLLDGYGMAILNNAADTISTALYYGYKGGHGHYDRLHFSVFAHGQPLMPDLGYPDFMNGYVPGIYTWSKNTIAHNTVTVDATRQLENQAGTVHLFAASPLARVVDIDAPETYPQCTVYRRRLVMIDAGPDASYFVDLFTVEGGTQHDYSLHGPPGTCEIVGGSWRSQDKGTLAGEDVGLAEIYDDAERAAEGFEGTYYGYTGSGFQHLFNVKRLVEGDWLAEYAHEKAPETKLRIRLLPQPGTEIIAADAQVSPVKQKQLIRYLIARRTGDALQSRYASVIEPFTGAPLIRSVERIELPDGAVAVLVERAAGGTDVVLDNPAGSAIGLDAFGIQTDANVAVFRLAPDAGRPVAAFCAGGRALSLAGTAMALPAAITGEVVAVDASNQRIRVRLADGQAVDPAALVGRVVHFENAFRRTAHPVAAASVDGGQLVLTTRDDLLVGRANLTAIEEQALRTDTPFMFAPVYRGVYAADAAFTRSFPIQEALEPDGGEPGAIRLTAPLPEGHPFAVGSDAWLVNVGPGDRLDVPAVFHWAAER